MTRKPRILYMSGSLPIRSETFVYREILTLRGLGLDVQTASVHAPMHGLDNGVLEKMACDTIELYSSGMTSVFVNACVEVFSHPLRSVRTLMMVLGDALTSNDVTLSRRPKVVWQGITGLALARKSRTRSITHIHAHMAHVPTTIAMYAARQLGITFSFTGHAIDLFPNRTLLGEKIRRANAVHCISHWHREFYRTICSKDDGQLPIVRCGVDTNAYQTSPAPRDERLRVLGVGRLVSKKGFDVLVEAAGILADRGIMVDVQIAGGGPEFEDLAEQIDQLPPGASVQLLGETDNDRVMELMSEVDVFALPCRITDSGDRDGIPVVLMEAMARGRCVISGDLETIRELIEDQISGVMIRPGNRDDLVESLIMLADNREKVDDLGKTARRRIEDEFDLGVNGARILQSMRANGVLEG